jgi:hypothetical protein
MHKLSALFDHAESKGSVDVFFIDKEVFPFSHLLKQERKKHVGLDNYWLAISLLKVQDLKVPPRMVKGLDLPQLQEFFLPQATQLTETNPQNFRYAVPLSSPHQLKRTNFVDSFVTI